MGILTSAEGPSSIAQRRKDRDGRGVRGISILSKKHSEVCMTFSIACADSVGDSAGIAPAPGRRRGRAEPDRSRGGALELEKTWAQGADRSQISDSAWRRRGACFRRSRDFRTRHRLTSKSFRRRTKIADRLNTNVGLAQSLPWGGRYNVGWDGSRSTTTNIFSNFSPQVRSSLALTYVQPLLRGFSIDTPRQQLLLSHNTREIADVTLRQAIAVTSRTVRHAYWDLVFAIAALDVQRQSLVGARVVRHTRARSKSVSRLRSTRSARAELARARSVILAKCMSHARTAPLLIYYPPRRFLDARHRTGGVLHSRRGPSSRGRSARADRRSDSSSHERP